MDDPNISAMHSTGTGRCREQPVRSKFSCLPQMIPDEITSKLPDAAPLATGPHWAANLTTRWRCPRWPVSALRMHHLHALTHAISSRFTAAVRQHAILVANAVQIECSPHFTSCVLNSLLRSSQLPTLHWLPLALPLRICGDPLLARCLFAPQRTDHSPRLLFMMPAVCNW